MKAFVANSFLSSMLVEPFFSVNKSIKVWYWFLSDTIRVSLKFLAVARIKEIPPISIFSIISASLLVFLIVSSKGYKSTITKSIGEIWCCANSIWSFSWSRRAKIPPKILGCKVLTRPSKISGKPV